MSTDSRSGSSGSDAALFTALDAGLFATLFAAFAFDRGLHPEVFRWGMRFLDRHWGAVSVAMIVASAFGMIVAAEAARRGNSRLRFAGLLAALVAGIGFLAVKVVEDRPKIEHRLLWGARFAPDEEFVAARFGGEGTFARSEPVTPKAAEPGKSSSPAAAVAAGDLVQGEKIARETCASCHGADLRGMPRNGLNLVTSAFVASQNDDQLTQFLIAGRQSYEPGNTTGVAMPPRGGNPLLSNERLRDVVAYLRKVQVEAPKAAEVPAEADPASTDVAVAAAFDDFVAPSPAPAEIVPHWVVPLPPWGPAGLVTEARRSQEELERATPAHADRFFAIYFLLSGLLGLHVVVGIIVIVALMVRCVRHGSDSSSLAAVRRGGWYWCYVSFVALLMYPLMYWNV